MGSVLIPTYIYFRHRQPVIHRLLAVLMRLVAYG
jgi:hypothetical protein